MMDELAQYNQERWDALAEAQIIFSQPWLHLDRDSARKVLVEQQGVTTAVLNQIAGKEVLCLASGGGQQSAAFGLLGARVTVFDLSETQLQRDREAAAHYGLTMRLIQGDMRDLSIFTANSFDFIWQPYSINFVPDPRPVFREVARIIRPGGLYRLQFANPFVQAIEEEDWDGNGYPLNQPYVDGAEIIYADTAWTLRREDGSSVKVEGPHEFRHALSVILTELAARGFVLQGLWEDSDRTPPDPEAAPGTWEHFIAVAPPFLVLRAAYQPG